MQTPLPQSQDYRKTKLRQDNCGISNGNIAGNLYFGFMEGKAVLQFLAGSNMSQAELARRVGMDPTALNKSIRGSRQFKAKEADKIRAIMETAGFRRKVVDTYTQRSMMDEREQNPPAGHDGVLDALPVFGKGMPDENGAIIMGRKASDFTERPTILEKVEDGYALWVPDDSMSPRYEPGELVYIHPSRPTPPGAWVVVQLRCANPNDRAKALIRRLVEVKEKTIRVSQLNPERELILDKAHVLKIERIVQSGER